MGKQTTKTTAWLQSIKTTYEVVGGFFTSLGAVGGTTAIGFFTLLAPTLEIRSFIVAGGMIGGLSSYFWSINYWKTKPKEKRNIYFLCLLALSMFLFMSLLFLQELISDSLAEKYETIAEIREFFMRAMSVYHGLYFLVSFLFISALVSTILVIPSLNQNQHE